MFRECHGSTETKTPRIPLIDKKVQFLEDSLANGSVLHLNFERWNLYARSAPRNYSMIVLFLVANETDCPPCKFVQEEFTFLADSYRRSNTEQTNAKALYFGLAVWAVDDASEIFAKLELTTVPVLYHFPPKGRWTNDDMIDYQNLVPMDAEAMANFISYRTEIEIKVVRPMSAWAQMAIVTAAALLFSVIYLNRSDPIAFLTNRTLWAFISLAIVFAFLSGQMWNWINNPPLWVGPPRMPEWYYVARQFRYQLISETCMVAALYAGTTLGIFVLDKAVSISGGKALKRLTALGGLAMFAGSLYTLFKLFRQKYPSYPYHLLPFDEV